MIYAVSNNAYCVSTCHQLPHLCQQFLMCDYCVSVSICFVQQIIKICLEYIVYDPNYNYDDEHGDDNMETDDDEDAEYGSCLIFVIVINYAIYVYVI